MSEWIRDEEIKPPEGEWVIVEVTTLYLAQIIDGLWKLETETPDHIDRLVQVIGWRRPPPQPGREEMEIT